MSTPNRPLERASMQELRGNAARTVRLAKLVGPKIKSVRAEHRDGRTTVIAVDSNYDTHKVSFPSDASDGHVDVQLRHLALAAGAELR